MRGRYAARVARLERALSVDTHAATGCQHRITVHSYQPDPESKSEYHGGDVMCIECRAPMGVVNITFLSSGHPEARYA